jgi:hypothetical protein
VPALLRSLRPSQPAGFNAIKDVISAPAKPVKSREYRPVTLLSLRNRKFADSLLEEALFELQVPSIGDCRSVPLRRSFLRSLQTAGRFAPSILLDDIGQRTGHPACLL